MDDPNNIKHSELYRSIEHRTISGVCFGLAEYFKIDVTIIRMIFIASLFFSYYTLFIYFAAAIIIPKNPSDYDDDSEIDSVLSGDKTILFALIFAGLGFLILWSSFSIPLNPLKLDLPSKLITGLLLFVVSFYFIMKRLNDPNLEDESRNKLYRKRDNKIISGIAAGFADQFNIDVSIVRLMIIIFCMLEPYIFVIFSLVYLAVTFILPYKDDLSTQDS